MKLDNFYRKPISVFVMVSFTILLCFWANQSPAAPAAPAAEKSSATALEKSQGESSGFMEQEDPEHAIKKGKKFPWLIVAVVAVVGGAALYFLVLKKIKYELTVTLGAGTTGTPSTNKYKKGEVVPYSFSAQSGYGNLQVMLDGALVASDGNVTMNKAHTITTTATQGITVNITSTPSGAKIYDNNADSGKTTPASISYYAAGTHTYLLRLCGYQDYSKTQNVMLGQTTYSINATMLLGIHDDFIVPASSCWLPNYPSSWSTILEDNVYQCKGSESSHSINFYNSSLGGDYTITVRMNWKSGHIPGGSIFLGASTSATNANGYLFGYDCYDYNKYSVSRINGYNFETGNGAIDNIKQVPSSAIHGGLNKWNILKIVKVGTNYTFYINDAVMYSFTDAKYTPHYLALAPYFGGFPSEMVFDYVYLK